MGPTSIAGLLVATLGGAAVGLERQWSGHATGPHARVGGIRTFALLGGLAGLAGWLSVGELRPFAIVLLVATVAVVVIGYAIASTTDIDGTTEVAALVVVAAGVLGGIISSTSVTLRFARDSRAPDAAGLALAAGAWVPVRSCSCGWASRPLS